MDVGQWLNGLELGEYTDLFVAHGMSEESVAALDDERLKAMGVTLLGHRRRILSAAEKLKAALREAETRQPPEPLAVQELSREPAATAAVPSTASGATDLSTEPTRIQPTLASEADVLAVEAQPPRSRRRRWWIGGGILALVLIGAGAAVTVVLLSRSEGANASGGTAERLGAVVATTPAPQVAPSPAPPPTAEVQAKIAVAQPPAPPPVVAVPTFTHEVFNTVVDSEEPWLNLRTARNAKSSVIARMRDGTPLRVIDATGIWWEVEVADGSDKGKRGFANQRWIRSVR